VTWIRAAEEYDLFFNRDELSSRGPESGPRAETKGDVRFLAPRDGDGGGTWIAVNEFGLSLGLLNGYAPSRGPSPARRTSRGAIILSLVEARDPAGVAVRLRALDLRAFQPFALLVVAPAPPGQLHEWDGLELRTTENAESRMPLASSSVDQRGASTFRRAQLAELAREAGGLSVALLERFHRSHPGGPGPLTPCMHRADASTRSHCHIHVGASTVELAHAPGSPCRTELGPPLGLARRSIAPATWRG
jgi:hypothetical protein